MSSYNDSQQDPVVLFRTRATIPALPDATLGSGTFCLLLDENTLLALRVVAEVQQWVPFGGGSGQSSVIRYAIGTAATQDSVAKIPPGAVVLYASVEIDTPYDGGATIEVGSVAAPDLLLATTDVDPSTAVILYDAVQSQPFGAGGVVQTTIGGAPTVGAGVVTVVFAVPEV